MSSLSLCVCVSLSLPLFVCTGVLTSENNKLMTPYDVSTNDTVRELMKKEMIKMGEKAKNKKKTVNRIKGGLLRAKMVGKLYVVFLV